MAASTGSTEAAVLLSEVDDQIASCRAWGHDWPSRQLRPGRPLPKGYSPRLIEGGCVEITETCANGCGKQRWWALLPGGVYDLDVIRRYVNPRNWKVIPQSEGVTRRHFQAEAVRRVNEDIMTVARRQASGRPAPAAFRSAGDE